MAATASLQPEGLAIEGATDGARYALWRDDDIRLVDGGNAEPQIRLARIDSAERLTILAADALPQLERRCLALHRSATRGLGWRLVAAWSAAAVAAALILFWIVIPFVARHVTPFISPPLEAELGNRVANAVIGITTATKPASDPAECDTQEGRAALERLVTPLTRQLTLRNPLRIRVVNSPILNAIALPGGQILLFKGLLDFTDDPNEVAGVVAHEVGHLALDHPTTLVIERGATAFLIGLIAGDVFGISVADGIGATVLDASYGREAESAADRRGSELMTGAGLDQAPVARFFTRMAATGKDRDLPIGFLRSHPASAERAKLFERKDGGGSALDAAGWKALKEICGNAAAALPTP